LQGNKFEECARICRTCSKMISDLARG
jgi:hypothetical protein